MLRLIVRLLTLASMVFTGIARTPTRTRDASNDTYEIYPIVRNIEYGNSTLAMTKEVNFLANAK